MGCLALSPAKRTENADEVLYELKKKRIRRAPFIVAALVLFALGAVRLVRCRHCTMWWRTSSILRLCAWLCSRLSAARSLAALAEGAAQEVFSRLRDMRSGRRSIAFIEPSTLGELHIQTPEQAEQGVARTRMRSK